MGLVLCGEGLLLLLRGVWWSEACLVLERIVKQIMNTRFSQHQLSVRVSIGAAQFRIGEGGEQLLVRADRLLYEAKRRGRNRVVSESLTHSNGLAK